METKMYDENALMLKARLEIANQQVKDLETQVARNAIDPAIYAIYADCRWGVGLSREDLSGAQATCRQVMELFESAQDSGMLGFAELPDLRDHSMNEGIIKVHFDELGEVRSTEDLVEAKDVLARHIQTLAKMADSLGDGAPFANLRLLLTQARQGLESARAVLGKEAAPVV